MKIIVKMTKDKKEHRRFLVFVSKHAVKTTGKILEQMEKKTGVPWQVNEEKSDSRFLAVETIDYKNLRALLEKANPEDEKAFVNWRMEWKNTEFEIATGK
jgi:hypothetical protein